MLEVEYPSSWLMRTYVPARVVLFASIISGVIIAVLIGVGFHKLGIAQTHRRYMSAAIAVTLIGFGFMAISSKYFSRKSEMLIDKQRKRIRYAGGSSVAFDAVEGFAVKKQLGGVLSMNLRLKDGKSWTVVKVSERDPLAQQKMANLADALHRFAGFPVHV